MRKTRALLVICLVSLTTVVFFVPQPESARAWGLVTHQFIVSEALEGISNVSWVEAFNFYKSRILSGSITPDQSWQDWDNHLYYPETGEYNAPAAAARWYENAYGNFSLGEWSLGFWSMGVMSHYYADPCIPVHTDEWWPGHSGYEADINENYATLSITSPSESIVTNVSQFVVDSAVYSHQFYDDVYSAYDDEDSRALTTNPTIKSLTEDCISMAIDGCLSLFYNLTLDFDAPDISATYEYVALLDNAHENDYISMGQLALINESMVNLGFKMRIQTSAFTESDLLGVDLLVLTCGNIRYTAAELDAIVGWTATGNRTIIITGRGDYSIYTDTAVPNQILDAIGSNIRINDDNVYTQGTYQPWYNDIYTIPAAAETLNITYDVDSITFFSPNSLYFLDDGPILPVIYADTAAYQTNQLPPDIEVIYDDVMDGEYGDQIPLAAVEEINGTRLLTAGTTFFSDFDYGKTETFDNIGFLENFLQWGVGNRSGFVVPDVDEVGPRISDISWDAELVEGELANVSAVVSDPSGVSKVFLKHDGETTEWPEMIEYSATEYKVTIPGISKGDLSFWIEANDTAGNVAIRASFDINWFTDTTDPEWLIIPSDQIVCEGEPFSYQLNASDDSGIGSWMLNDTENFSITQTGLITNATTLVSGNYGLNVTVTDIYGNSISSTFRVTVLPTTETTATTPYEMTIALIVAVFILVLLIVVVAVLLTRKR